MQKGVIYTKEKNEVERMTFSRNLNNKLNCKAFATISVNKNLRVGEEFRIFQEELPRGTARIISVSRHFLASEITDTMAYIATGFDRIQAIKILKQEWKRIDWQKEKFCFVVFKFIDDDF